MIGSLRIENYKIIENLDLNLGPLNVLVGPNGSGKTAIVEVLSLIQNMAQTGFSFEENLPRAFRWTAMGGFLRALKDGANEMMFEFSDDGNSLHVSILPSEKREPTLKAMLCNGENYSLVEFPQLRNSVRGWQFYKFNDVYILGRDYKKLSRIPGENALHLLGTGENLPQVILGLKVRNDKVYNRIRGIFLAAISDQAPESDLSLDEREIVLLNLVISNLTLPYRDWPDGWKKFLALVVAIETATNLFVIEEPENYLHPGLLHYFMDLVKERVEEGLQVIITTHSPILVNLISDTPDSLIMMDNGRAARITDKDKDYLKKIDKLLGMAYFGGLFDGPGDS